MEKHGHKFYLFITGIEQGKRKEKTHKIDAGFYEEELSPELFNAAERKAWREAEGMLKTMAKTGTLAAYKAKETEDMLFCGLVAEKSQTVMR